jgi:CRISPR-associated endonuclease Csn1
MTKTLTLGLDIGTNSIGWALMNEEAGLILNSGVRIFQEGINIDAKSKAESPKNAKRREYRQKRRQLFRRKLRNQHITKVLEENGLYPATEAEKASFWQIDPYHCRKKGLDTILSPMELGRVFLHISQRRGFKSNRKSLTEGEEKGALQKGLAEKVGIDATLAEWQTGNFRTFGEYLASLDPHVQRIRNRYTLRDWYEQEINMLWIKQKEFYPDLLTHDLKTKLADPRQGIIFYQRPLKSQKHTLGKCVFEPAKPRSLKSHPDFEEFRMWQIINNITISGPGRTEEPLDDAEKTKLVELFYSKLKITPAGILKKVNLTSDYKLNYDDDTTFTGNETTIKLEKIFGKDCWASKTRQQKEDIWHALHFFQDADKLQEHARDKWAMAELPLQILRKTHLVDGYSQLSRKAINKLLPFLRQGLPYHEAAQAAGYHHSQIAHYAAGLPKLEAPLQTGNPIVQQALFEVRTLVNNIISTYGKPHCIRIELARDLKISKERRAKVRVEQVRNQRRNEEIKTKLIQFGINRPSANDIQKYVLWQECRQICPYTGKSIALADLFNGRFEIEHILPYSRTLDDSLANKTLCCREFNNLKRNKTPFECLGGNPISYNQVLDRVRENNSHKLKKFLQKELDAEGFIQRQLNDTRYISRETKEYLKSICEHVSVTQGSVTAYLRHYWGLNSILDETKTIKNRDDHRHHAVDALVVACTTPRMLQELSRWNGQERAPHIHNFQLPWSTFYRDCYDSVRNILVSIRKKDKIITTHRRKIKLKNGRQVMQKTLAVRGQLHKETIYGKRRDTQNQEFFAVRKPLTDLTPAMVHKIVDPAIKKLVMNRLQEHGADPLAKKFEISKMAFAAPLYLPNNQGGRPYQIKKVRIRENSNPVLLKEGLNQWVEPGNNHHVAIYTNNAGRKKEVVISFWEAVERKKQGLPVFSSTLPDGSQLLTTLQINDMFILNLSDENINWQRPDLTAFLRPYLYRVQKLSASYYTFRFHQASTLEYAKEEISVRSMKAWEKANPIKIAISVLGQVKKI